MSKKYETLALHDILQKRNMTAMLIGILLIPLVYSCLYLWAFYDPDSLTKNLPVAVVNEDRGAVVEGEEVNVGKELVERLKKDDRMHWDFVTRKEMERGFQENRYYLGIVIPGDFSRRLAGAGDRHPEKGLIQYYANEGANYLSSQIGARMIRDLEDHVERNLTKAFAEELFDKLGQSAGDLTKASDGARRLAGASGRAVGAADQLERGIAALQNGMNDVERGTDRLQRGAHQLETGLGEAKNASGRLADGADQLASGIRTMRDQVREKKKGLRELRDGAEAIRQGLASIQEKLSDPRLDRGARLVSDIARRIKGGNSRVEEAYRKLLEKHPELANDPEMRRLREALDREWNNSDSLLNHAARLEMELELARNAVDRMVAGQGRVVEGIGQIETGLDQMVQALNLLLDGATALSDHLHQLDQGLTRLHAGAATLSAGLDRLAEAPGRLSAGLAKLDGGMGGLRDGLAKILDGQETLANKLAHGVAAARDQLLGKDDQTDLLADPVRVDEDAINPVPNYATGFAPYFISLALWVGAVVLFTVIDLKRPVIGSNLPLSTPTVFAVGASQALLLVSVLTYGLDIRAKNPGWFCAFAVITAFTFMAINHFLIGVFKDPGRFVAILVMMLQLTSCGGTYPVEMQPDFFREIHPFLPMTYSVEGLRAAVSTGDTRILLHDVVILLGYTVGACLLKELGQRLRDRAGFRLRTAE